jgi:predicted 3-demethylubiquinone-9 3-methyltransferase (glyoxalase superfamily)
MPKIVPCLWFDDNAEEAVKFYTSIFENSRIKAVTHYGQAGSRASGRPVGTVMTVAFQLDGQELLALNGGPHFTFSPAISLVARCKTQKEIDDLWKKLSRGGRIEQCGWLKDRFGVSWQVVPARIGTMMRDTGDGRADRVMTALLEMRKIDMGALERAYRQPKARRSHPNGGRGPTARTRGG